MKTFEQHEELYSNDSSGNYTKYMNIDHAKQVLVDSGEGVPESDIDRVACFMYATDSSPESAVFELGLV